MDSRAPLICQVDVAVAALRRLATERSDQFPVLLDSAADGPLARYSMLMFEPRAVLLRDGEGRVSAQGFDPGAGGFIDNLAAWLRREATPRDERKPLPFMGGWFVYLSYEVAQEVEPVLRLPRAAGPYSAFALRIEHLVVHEHASGKTFVVSQNGNAATQARLIDALREASLETDDPPDDNPHVDRWVEEPAERHLERVRRIKDYIAAGDIYQANISRPWRLRLRAGSDPRAVYAALRRSNPAPFAASVRFGGMTILSSSPERLLKVEGREISTRPIAGTRPRGDDPDQDARVTAELVSHPKERAEHVMLIDLERNDLGRVCEAGSVRVDEYMVTETYAHVHHIVSNVRGRLRAEATAVDALRALFPGGTITGCPKVRCMQIIAELEGEGRGAYTGSLGWLGTDGDADFNILIRTLTLRGDQIELRAGGGIVADSVPEREIEETRAKALGLLRAFEPT
ncbi:MAG TPA: aminodeoxychorismate synthase component I [Steroidobacteraceae bacterium]|nr:aminodeoxychorismate synthase component I [Steroidobacteraceae bacterium]